MEGRMKMMIDSICYIPVATVSHKLDVSGVILFILFRAEIGFTFIEILEMVQSQDCSYTNAVVKYFG